MPSKRTLLPFSLLIVLLVQLLDIAICFECTFLYIVRQGQENIPKLPHEIHDGDRSALPACPEGAYNDTWPSETGCRLTCPDTLRRTCITYGYVNNADQGVLHMTCSSDTPAFPNDASVTNCTDNTAWGTTTQTPDWMNTKCGECFFTEYCLPEAFAGYKAEPGEYDSGGSGGGDGGGASNQPTTSPVGNIVTFCILSVFFAVGVVVL